MSEFVVTEKNRVNRLPERGRYDPSTIYDIIDEAMVCHIGFIQDNRPVVIPALHARMDDQLLIHGASTSRLLKYIQTGNEVSISIALVDGIVLAKTVFNQSVNYRSVVLFGRGRLIEDEAEKLRALKHFTERMMPGQWDAVRQPYPKEVKATSIVAIFIDEASAKVRSGPPKDGGEDQDLPVWAGVLPLKQVVQPPIAADYTDDIMPIPEHILKYIANAKK